MRIYIFLITISLLSIISCNDEQTTLYEVHKNDKNSLLETSAGSGAYYECWNIVMHTCEPCNFNFGCLSVIDHLQFIIFTDVVESGEDAIMNYFATDQHLNLYPELNNEPEILLGLKNGENKIIHFTNTSGSQFYLIGNQNSPENDIINNPIYVLKGI